MSARINDGGYSQQHDSRPPGGREGARRQGRDRPTSKTSTKAPTPSAPSSASRATGCKLIFTTSFGFMDADAQGRQATFPNVKFEHATGYKTADNLAHLQSTAGTKAATSWARSPRRCRRPASPATSSPSRFPEVVMGIDAFMLGAQSVNPELQGQDRLGELLVRSGQGRRRRQGAVRPGRRHHRPAHRLAGRHAGRRAARHPRLRPVGRHDQVRAERAAHLADRQLGPVLHPARSRRCSTAPGSRPDVWDGIKDDGSWSRPHQHARRREEDGREDAGRDQGRQAASVQVPGDRAGRHTVPARAAPISTTGRSSA